MYRSFTGLPTEWSKPAEAQRIDSLLDMSPEADAAISVPWNFTVWGCHRLYARGDCSRYANCHCQHRIHVFVGYDRLCEGGGNYTDDAARRSDGIPTGLPQVFVSRLGELGFSEGEIAAIRKQAMRCLAVCETAAQ